MERLPNGSKGIATEIAAKAAKRAAQIYIGAGVAVFAYVATIPDMIPIIRLYATPIPLPVVRCAEGRTSGV
jgi:hypothetical protein